jgi:hypothetical protein
VGRRYYFDDQIKEDGSGMGEKRNVFCGFGWKNEG